MHGSAESLDYDRIVREHGEWTAMAIHLGDGRYTREPAPDHRLRRLLQVVTDLLGRPLTGCRVLDLACLEGHYGIEFALHGAEVVGLEIRESNLAKARFATEALGLSNVHLVRDDVRNLSRAKYGTFDVVLCSGILYHLDVPDVFELVRSVHEVTRRLAVIDTQIALTPRIVVEHGGRPYAGLLYTEHEDGADAATRYDDSWASLENSRSFWLTHASLANLVADAGFSSFLRLEHPVMPDTAEDRVTYVAMRGEAAEVRSSPPTRDAPRARMPERCEVAPNRAQVERGPAYRLWKRALPRPVREVVKAGLRAVRLLPPDTTPAFVKANRARRRARVKAA